MVILQGLILVVLPPEFTISVAATPFAKIASTTVPAGMSYALAAAGTAAFAAYRLYQHRERVSTGSPASLAAVVVPPWSSAPPSSEESSR